MSALSIPTTRFRSATVPPHEQFDAWRAHISAVFDVAPVAAGAGFVAEVDAFHLGDFVLTRTRFAAQYFLRAVRRTRTDRLDHYLVQFYREGGYVGQAGEAPICIEPGSVSILDTARTVSTQATPAECLTLVVPRDVMDDVLPAVGDLHGLVLPDASGGLFADYLESLERRLPGLEVTQAPYVVRATCELLAACIRPSSEYLDRALEQIETLQRRKVTRHIDRHLDSPRLSAAAISKALGIPPAQLELLFEPLGGIERHILLRRLEHIRSALVRRNETRSIAELAFVYGFGSADDLRSAFRAEFGYAPDEIGTGAETDPADALGVLSVDKDPNRVSTLYNWVSTLRR